MIYVTLTATNHFNFFICYPIKYIGNALVTISLITNHWIPFNCDIANKIVILNLPHSRYNANNNAKPGCPNIISRMTQIQTASLFILLPKEYPVFTPGSCY